MTSRISLSKMLRLEIKERSYLAILITIVAFLAIPCFYLIDLQNKVRFLDASSVNYAADLMMRYRNCAVSHLSGGNVLIRICAIVGALLTAFSGFSYLYKKEKNDMIQSLALTRQDKFHVTALAGWLMGVVPYVVMTLISLLVISPVYGVLNVELLGEALSAMLFFVLQFTAAYFLIILAIVLTGRYVTGILLAGFALLYLPALLALIESLFTEFFRTYYAWIINRYNLYFYFSPAFVPSQGSGNMVPAVSLLVMALMMVLFYTLSRLYYVKRPSEATGDALTYTKMLPALKLLITIPAAIGGTEIVRSFIGDRSLGWVVFAAAMTAVLVGGIIEFIESTDVHQCFRHWKTTVVSAVAAIVILLVFRMDLLGFDAFMPSENDIYAMSVSKRYVGSVFGDYYEPTGNIDEECVTLKAELYEDFGPLYDLAVASHDFTLTDEAEINAVYCGDWETTDYVDSVVYEDTVEAAVPQCISYSQEVFCFKLKSGRTVYRRYNVRLEDLRAAVAAISEDKAYRDRVYPIRDLKGDDIAAIGLTHSMDERGAKPMMLGDDDKAALIESLKADMLSVSIGDVDHEEPVVILDFRGNYNGHYDNYVSLLDDRSFYKMAVYPQYARTLAFLEAHDYKSYVEPVTMPETDRVEVSIRNLTYRITDREAVEKLFGCVREIKWNERADENIYVRWYTEYSYDVGISVYVKDRDVFETVLKTYGTCIGDPVK